MNILITYSSRTGNTKKLCEGVYNSLKDKFNMDIEPLNKKTEYEKYDTVVVGYWVDKGTANAQAKKFITKIRNKNVVLLGTLGASPDSEHGHKTRKNVGNLIDESNYYLGVFLARGKVDPKLTKKIKLLPLPKKIKDQMYESSINSRETNEQDIENAVVFLEKALS